jgi:hypothetical protein
VPLMKRRSRTQRCMPISSGFITPVATQTLDVPKPLYAVLYR